MKARRRWRFDPLKDLDDRGQGATVTWINVDEPALGSMRIAHDQATPTEEIQKRAEIIAAAPLLEEMKGSRAVILPAFDGGWAARVSQYDVWPATVHESFHDAMEWRDAERDRAMEGSAVREAITTTADLTGDFLGGDDAIMEGPFDTEREAQEFIDAEVGATAEIVTRVGSHGALWVKVTE